MGQIVGTLLPLGAKGEKLIYLAFKAFIFYFIKYSELFFSYLWK